MTRTQMMAIGGMAAIAVVLTATGVAEASASGHHDHRSHGHSDHDRHDRGRVGDDVYSSRHSEDYGQQYGIVSGLIWDLTHSL